MPEQALVLVLDEPGLASIRERLYPDAVARGLPLHLTLLYPFAGALQPARELFAGSAPLTFALARLGEFPGGFAVVVPEPQQELRKLMRDLWALYPESPPYGGEILDPEPHATIGRGPADPALVEPLLPVEVHVGVVTLLREREPGCWAEHERLPLGRA